MKWVWIVLGVLASVVAGAALIGALLPREHRASSQVTLRQSPESVWTVVRDLGRLPAFWSDLKATERLPDQNGNEAWAHTMKSGYRMPLEVMESTPPRRLVTRIASPPGAPFGGSWIYEIEAADGGSRITVTEQGWIANPVFRFVARVTGYYGTLDSYLTALGRRFGEEIRPVHVL